MPRSPSQAKGLLLSSIFEHNDPVVFMEPKILYRAAVEHVPNEYYTIPLSKAEVIKPGKDLTIISYGQPLYLCSAAISAIEKTMKGVNIELIDLRTIYPWDRQTVLDSVRKTGRAVVVHESMINYGVGAEVAATIQDGAFLRLEAPVKRVAGWSTHTGLSYEQFILPDVASMCLTTHLPLCLPVLMRIIFRDLRCHQTDHRILSGYRAKTKPSMWKRERKNGTHCPFFWRDEVLRQ